jgi:hypothetical protein
LFVNPEVGVGEDEEPVSPEESLRLIQAQRAAAVRSLSPDPRLIYWPWGVAWLVGFALLYLRHGPGDRITVPMPSWLPVLTLYVLMIIAFVVSGVAGAKANRDISGESSRRGLMYGLSWFAGFFGNAVICAHLSQGLLPETEVGLLWAATSVGLVGLLYMAGAAVWNSTDLFVLGLWLTVSNIAGVVAGAGWHSLVISIAGGGGLLVGGFLQWLNRRRQL